MIYALWYSLSAYSKSTSNSIVLFLFMVIIYLAEIFFILMLASLVIFHTYLAINNLTTWECLSWSNISYMIVWPRKYGSPFSKGLKANLMFYFWYPLKVHEVMQWELPKRLPSYQEGEILIRNSPISRMWAKYWSD